MKRIPFLGLALLLAAIASIGYAQVTGPVGQTAGGAINQSVFDNNSDAAGFNEMSLTPTIVVPATATTQALATLIVTRTNFLTTCSGTTGVRLPAVQRYVPITVVNRSGGSCLIWPSIGATVETALGTSGAVNASFTMLTNTTITFSPVTGRNVIVVFVNIVNDDHVPAGHRAGVVPVIASRTRDTSPGRD